MKKYVLPFPVFYSNSLLACVVCNKEIRGSIWNNTFFPHLLLLLSSFFVLALLVIVFSIVAAKKYSVNSSIYPQRQFLSPVPLTVSGIVLGMGAGGFVDGIVFHQLLQWHQLLSGKLFPDTLVTKSVNMFWDGVFHAFCLLVMLTGVFLLWRNLWRKDIDRSSRLLIGGMFMGWGLFNMVEGGINHHLLKLHNVKELTTHPLAWNIGFLLFSLLLLIAGILLIKRKNTNKPEITYRSWDNGIRRKIGMHVK